VKGKASLLSLVSRLCFSFYFWKEISLNFTHFYACIVMAQKNLIQDNQMKKTVYKKKGREEKEKKAASVN
jgi:hypothetical protein